MKAILDNQIDAEQGRLDSLKDEYAFLTGRADRLLSSSLDKDLLEERVRSVLGLVHQDEFMVRMDDLDRLASLAPDASAPQVRYAVLGQPSR